MRGTRQNVIQTAILVAKAGCARVGRELGVASVVTALGLLVGLGVGGCSMSHGGSGVDRDGDGYDTDVDCNDADPRIYPGAPEGWSSDCCELPGVDYDCDGMPLICSCNPIPDWDGDGYLSHEDCNDSDPSIHPGALDDLCPDGVDQDCDGEDAPPDPTILCAEADADRDGHPRYYDCDDADPNIHPGIAEPDDSCQDGVDQNCDGVDNGFICNGMADADDVDWSHA